MTNVVQHVTCFSTPFTVIQGRQFGSVKNWPNISVLWGNGVEIKNFVFRTLKWHILVWNYVIWRIDSLQWSWLYSVTI